MSRPRRDCPRCHGPQRGFSLIELMVSLLLGLLVMAAAIGIFLSNQRTYRATQRLARIQEDARVAFELMAREVRQAGGSSCAMNLPVANVLNGAGAATVPWWMNWDRGVVGYDNGGLPGAAAGTDAIEFLLAGEGAVTVTRHDLQAVRFQVEPAMRDARAGEIVLICDPSQASILQLSAVRDGGTTLEYGPSGLSPGNCTSSLGAPVVCSGQGSSKTYRPNALIAKLHAVRWFIAKNGHGGQSLYRVPMVRGDVRQREEIAERIKDMQITYLVAGATGYIDAGAGVDWKHVVAVRLSLTLEDMVRAGTEPSTLTRTLVHTVSLRNRTS
ncbi:prepilin-type N-terminal cleavage/methylation domain-containing protein [Luteibacter sp.]|uniref:prepilin-type N-terminal cleavage/methylation domain-containing protein n=1 Tax=Luteibacter sp. TaxID=1886636 RepID=UPI0028068CEF|nr:prepilin-type N-terminal cleavage/methylation domain-containing protein [Luteibacter sp.]MDQ8051257.1 prepilin-type N-terminal cleavage/methylation domain-containing protein [Luteibacter sp.]